MAQQLAIAQQFAAKVAASSATVTSDDHAVTVTVGPGGSLTELRLSDRAMRYNGPALGRQIVEVIEQATAELTAALEQEIANVPGAGSNLSTILAGRLPDVPTLPPPPDEE